MGNWRKMNFIVLGIWNLRHVFTRDPWFWWIHGWMNMKGKRESERERECLLNPQGSTKWSSHTFEKALWVFTYIILLPISYWCAWNFLVYMLFGYLMKSDRQVLPAHKWWAHVFFEKKNSGNINGVDKMFALQIAFASSIHTCMHVYC